MACSNIILLLLMILWLDLAWQTLSLLHRILFKTVFSWALSGLEHPRWHIHIYLIGFQCWLEAQLRFHTPTMPLLGVSWTPENYSKRKISKLPVLLKPEFRCLKLLLLSPLVWSKQSTNPATFRRRRNKFHKKNEGEERRRDLRPGMTGNVLPQFSPNLQS